MKIGNLSVNYKKDTAPVVIESVGTPSSFKSQVSFAESPYWDDWWFLPYNPDKLYQQKGDYSLFDEMRQDDQISSVLSLKKIITLNSPWTIESENEEIVEFITANFNDYLSEIFIKNLYEILSAFDYGFSVTEKVSGIVEWQGKQRYIWKDLKTRAPHSFEFDVDERGELKSVIQNVRSGQLKLDPKKFIVYAYNKEFDNPYGNSELNKGVYRAWWSKNAIIKFWNIYLERFGMPTTVGKMPRSAGEADKSRFKKILKNISAKTGITIPEDFGVELLQVGQGAGEYEAAIDKYNSFIARRMLIPDLMGFSGGETSGGSFALGQEQFDIFYTIISYIRQDIEKLINKHLVDPLVIWNYGNNEKAYFKFSPVDEDQKNENMKLWLDAVKSGKIPVNDASILWFLDSVDAPTISEEELQDIKDEKEAFKEGLKNDDKDETDNKDKPNISGDMDNEPGEVDNPDDSKEGDTENILRERNSVKKYQDGVDGYTLTEYEKKVDFKAIENKQDSIESEYVIRLSEIYTLSINDLIETIKKQKIIDNNRFEKVNKLTVKYQSRAKKIWKDMLISSYDYGKETVKKEHNYVANIEGLTPEETAQWLETAALYVASMESAFILKNVKGILVDAIRSGTGIREVVKMIEESLKGYSEVATDTARLKTIARTNISKAFNQARLNEYATVLEEIQAFQYSAILDNRTSALCSGLHGKIFKTVDLEYYNPPNHYNCRSMIVPIFINEKKAEITPVKDMPRTEQDSGDFLKLIK